MNIIALGRCLLLALSFYGYCQFYRKKVAAEISVALVMCSIASVMFFAGILNILKETAVVVFVSGIILAIISLSRHDRIKDMITGGTLVFVVMCVCSAIYLRGMRFSHYDNFSHWALAPKVLISKNRFPNFEDTYFTFKSYPLGSASFIYYFVKITGITSESMMMLAQAILLFSMVTSIFSLAHKLPGYLLATAASLILVAGDTGLSELLVDTLLPLVALAGIITCISLEDRLKDNLWITLPFTFFLISIKNSGILFVLVILCYAFFCTRHSFSMKTWIVIILSPFALLLLWQKHVDMVFTKGMTTKHAMSFSNYSTNLGRKTLDDIGIICQKLFSVLFSKSNTIIFLLVFLLIFAIVVKLFSHGNKRLPGSHLSVLALVCFVAYIVGLLGMYIVSMPTAEAVELGGFDRYYKTILIFVTGIIFSRVILLMGSMPDDSSHKIMSFALAIICGIASALTINPSLSSFVKHTIDERRVTFDRLIIEYHIPSEKKYIIAHEVDDGGYFSYLAKYLLAPNDVVSVTDDWFDANPSAWQNYDYLIVIEETEKNKEFIEENFEYREVINLKQYK